MSAPPWGHKPPPVDDATAYWTQSPPAPSPRCTYWLRRHTEGTWRPNRRLRIEGYHTAAEHLGIWIWEYLHLIRPLFDEEEGAGSTP
ncbi:hypothetical protein [Streptomyces prasinopilosus]|uniref:hypothetical protein n=1 Tax=Streptomyces prasinopilosus TaxID=67344 RepID=UPI000A843E7B|nr:hypothetical protein [Streptomyces prasinopilosus]